MSLTRDFTELERMVLAGPPRPEDFGLYGANYNGGKPETFAEYHQAAGAYWRKRAELSTAAVEHAEKGSQ